MLRAFDTTCLQSSRRKCELFEGCNHVHSMMYVCRYKVLTVVISTKHAHYRHLFQIFVVQAIHNVPTDEVVNLQLLEHCNNIQKGREDESSWPEQSAVAHINVAFHLHISYQFMCAAGAVCPS